MISKVVRKIIKNKISENILSIAQDDILDSKISGKVTQK